MLIAITRGVSPAIQNCQLTHKERQPIDLELSEQQHRNYQEKLSVLGCQVIKLPAEPNLPDSVFVEDVAIVLDEMAIITRPGAESRRPEITAVAEALVPFRELARITYPATLDGGDVLRVGKSVFVGISSRTNQAGFEQLWGLLEPLGYSVTPVSVSGCLHLKSAVTQVSVDTLLLNRDWIDLELFSHLRHIAVHPDESHAANALLIGEKIIYPSSYPRTRQRLEVDGLSLFPIDVSELIKAEGAVTCCSLVFPS